MRERAGSGVGGGWQGDVPEWSPESRVESWRETMAADTVRSGRAQSQASSDFSVNTNRFSVLHLHSFELDLYLITRSLTKIIKDTLKYCYLLVSGAMFSLANTLWALR